MRINVIQFVFNSKLFNLTGKSHSVDLLNKLLLVFCLRFFYYYCCCFYYNYYWFASRLLDTIIRKQLFSNVLNFIFLVNIDLTVKFFKCLTLHCYVFAGYNYEACAGRFKNIWMENSELSFCVYSITLWFCAIFFLYGKSCLRDHWESTCLHCYDLCSSLLIVCFKFHFYLYPLSLQIKGIFSKSHNSLFCDK